MQVKFKKILLYSAPFLLLVVDMLLFFLFHEQYCASLFSYFLVSLLCMSNTYIFFIASLNCIAFFSMYHTYVQLAILMILLFLLHMIGKKNVYITQLYKTIFACLGVSSYFVLLIGMHKTTLSIPYTAIKICANILLTVFFSLKIKDQSEQGNRL